MDAVTIDVKDSDPEIICVRNFFKAPKLFYENKSYQNWTQGWS